MDLAKDKIHVDYNPDNDMGKQLPHLCLTCNSIGQKIDIIAKNGTPIAKTVFRRLDGTDVHLVDAERHAESIVRACNSHEALLKILTEIVDFIDREGPASMEWRAISDACDRGRAAIAEATETP